MNTFTELDYMYMARAIKLAKKGWFTTSPNPRVGCVIVKGDQIVGEGFHKKAGEGHAEVNALKQAGELAKGATAYVTLEPCSHYGRTPPCAEALVNAGVKKVIAAMVDPNPKVSGNGLEILKNSGVETAHNLLADEAATLNPGFLHLMTNKKPLVRCKLAASLDGKIAMASGESKWITGSHARADVQILRAQSCAIISGADTVMTDDAKLNVRYEQLINPSFLENELRQPIRVIIDSKFRLTPDLALFSSTSPIILIRKRVQSLSTTQAKATQWPNHVEELEIDLKENTDTIDLSLLLAALAKRGMNDILLESGYRLAGAFIEQNLVDELILYQAPKLLGASAKSLVDLPSLTELSQTKHLNITSTTRVGNDLKIVATFNEINH